MWIVNENTATRRIVLREREPQEEGREANDTDPVVSETVVEFEPSGRARVKQEVGEQLIERFESVREATGPDDVAEEYTASASEEEEEG